MVPQTLTCLLCVLLSTIWYELQARDWPITRQPAEATIWQVGSGQGIRKVLEQVSLGKEVTVSSVLYYILLISYRCFYLFINSFIYLLTYFYSWFWCGLLFSVKFFGVVEMVCSH